MIYTFGNSSSAKLATANPVIAQIPRKVLSYGVFDLTIIWGYRSDAEQMQAFLSGNSKKKTGSFHQFTKNGEPFAEAIDFAPWCRLPTGEMGIPWNDTHAFAVLGGMMIAAGAELGVEIVYGGDWDMDGTTTDQTLMDWGHIQRAGANMREAT